MTSISATYARAHFAAIFRTCVDDSMPVRIKNKNKEVVCMDAAEWDAWQETMLLLSNPAEANRLRESIDQYERGETVALSLDDIDALLKEKSGPSCN